MTALLLLTTTLLIVMIFICVVIAAFFLGKRMGESKKRPHAKIDSNLSNEEIAELKRKTELEKRAMINFFNYDGSEQSPIDAE